MKILSIFKGHSDPCVVIVENGKILSYIEEERILRYKHAFGLFPKYALKKAFSVLNITPNDIDGIAVHWDLEKFSNGYMENFYNEMYKNFDVDATTKSFHKRCLDVFNFENLKKFYEKQWIRIFGNKYKLPPIYPVGHHFSHAYLACKHSPYKECLCITIDGSGDENCTVLWKYSNNQFEKLYSINMPYSLGWFYAAITEYLGFKAYDGEYKVMGLAAYGAEDEKIRAAMDQLLHTAEDGIGYVLNPEYIFFGEHTFSERFTDKLPDLFGKEPRTENDNIEKWHENLAYAAQKKLEEAVLNIIKWGIKKTGISNIAISGGVALNIKMNSAIYNLDGVQSVYPHPLSSDSGCIVGAALYVDSMLSKSEPQKIENLSFGPSYSDDEIESMLKLCQISYETPENIYETTAKLIADGKIIGWAQGGMEAGPRALGNRSILADPRAIASRDKVNAIIKFREYWRPFCPSILDEYKDLYFSKYIEAPFMIIAFKANEKLKREAPAIVHVDGTSRVQFVKEEANPPYHKLISEFYKLTNVPILLNTSFNIKGEPMVCSPQDCLRTFFATGLDALVLNKYLIRKK